MPFDNSITMVGNMTDHPVFDKQNGQDRAVFRIAVNRNWTNTDGSKGESVTYETVHAYGAKAVNLQNSVFSKGDRVIVIGSLTKWSYEDKYFDAIRAEDIGPSLMWATVDVTKAVRAQTPTVSDSVAILEMAKQAIKDTKVHRNALIERGLSKKEANELSGFKKAKATLAEMTSPLQVPKPAEIEKAKQDAPLDMDSVESASGKF